MTEQAAGDRWVGVNEGAEAWAGAAREILTEVAGHYLGVVTYADLAEQVQSRTGLRTRSPYRSWIGGVLARVVASCRADGLPPLSSLVAHRADGGIEPEEGTVEARFACYRRFADDVPAESIALADEAARVKKIAVEEAARERRPKAQAAAPRTRRQSAPEEPPKICPSCFMQLPSSGICDSCG